MQEKIDAYFQAKDDQVLTDARRRGMCFINKNEEDLIVALVKSINRMCASVTKEDVKRCIEAVAFQDTLKKLQYSFSDEVVDTLMKKNDLKLYKGKSIDPSRALQAREDVMLAFFAYLDHYCEMMNTADPTSFPYKSVRDLPAFNLFNMDEMASNPAHVCHNSLMSTEIAEELNCNIFIMTREGNQKVIKGHISVAICTNAAGLYTAPKYKTQGAPGPFYVLSMPSKVGAPKGTSVERMQALEDMTPDDEYKLNPAIFNGFEGAFSLFEKEGETMCCNDYAVCIDHSKNGSMTLETFYRFALHFVRYMPDSMGKGKEPAILLLDGHSSCWNPLALEYLLDNNVHCLFLPSKTSIWAQPNDNGINQLYHTMIDKAANESRIGRVAEMEQREHPFF